MEDTSRNPAALAVELAGHAYAWGQAVVIQSQRLRETDSPLYRHVDSYLLVIAMRQVLRCAEAMSKAVGGDRELAGAKAEFLNDHRNARAMRDVLSHFDEYQAGKGKLQKSGKVGRLAIWMGAGEDSFTLALASNLTLELSGASSSALALADATLAAKDRYLARLREGRT